MGFKYTNNKKKTKDNSRHVTKQDGTEKAELLSAIFVLVCDDKSSPYESPTQETRAQKY